jgi:hypothetical protein
MVSDLHHYSHSNDHNQLQSISRCTRPKAPKAKASKSFPPSLYFGHWYHLCSCCGKIHARKNTNVVKNSNNNTTNNKQNSANTSAKIQWNNANPSDNPTGGKDSLEWTAEEDATILKLKGEADQAGKTIVWNDVVAALGTGKTKDQVKARNKELQDSSNRDNSNAKSDAEKKAIGEQKKAENLAKQDNAGGGKKKGKGKGNDGGDGGGNKKNKNSDANNDIKMWASKFEQRKWLMAAAKHFDKTGERLTAEETRRKAEE